MTTTKRKRIALVGAGHIAQSHIRGAQALVDRAEVVAVVEVDHARLASFASTHSIPGRYDDLDALERVEAVSGARCSSVLQWRFGERVENFRDLIRSEAMGRALLALCIT